MNCVDQFPSFIDRESASVVACADQLGRASVRKALREAIAILQRRMRDVDSVDEAVTTLGAARLHSEEATAAMCTVVFIVAKALDLTPQHLTRARRDARGTYARHVCMYLAWNILGISMPQIALFFHRRDHSTALYARNRIQAELDAGKIDSAKWEELTVLTRKCAERHGLLAGPRDGTRMNLLARSA